MQIFLAMYLSLKMSLFFSFLKGIYRDPIKTPSIQQIKDTGLEVYYLTDTVKEVLNLFEILEQSKLLGKRRIHLWRFSVIQVIIMLKSFKKGSIWTWM